MMSEAIDHANTASPKTYRQNHHWLRLRVVWRFTRHLLEMVIAMVSGMAVLGAAIAALGEPPGYSNLFVEYGMMVVSMSAPMVAWMRYRGHSWLDGLEMTAAMLFPTFALVLPLELGVAVPGVSEGSLMMLSHVAMIAGMVALMVYRLDRYAHGTHGEPLMTETHS
jgi:flagellar biosynthetic protein FliP